MDFSGTSYDEGECTRVSHNGNNNAYQLSVNAADWTRFECTFTTTGVPLSSTVIFDPNGTGDVRVDAVMLEAGESATNYTEGYNSTRRTPFFSTSTLKLIKSPA